MKKLALSLLLVLGASTQAQAVPIEFNGHWYDRIDTRMSFNAALADAATRTHNGMTGYVATITSQAENDFIFNNLFDGNWTYIGASDAANEGNWTWVNGPEQGTQFWDGGIYGSSVAGNYENWSAREPNNWGNEDAAHMWGGGTWNDIPVGHQLKYFIEYSATEVSEPASIALFGLGLAGLGFVRRKRAQG